MKLIKRIIITLFLVLLIVVFWENYDNLQHTFTFRFNLHFIGWYTSKIPLWLVIIISFVIGYLVAYLPALTKQFSYKKKIKQLQKDLQAANTSSSKTEQSVEQK
ncbi:MAG: LapA family protein [bacterium]